MKRFTIILFSLIVALGCICAQSVKELEKQRKQTLQQLETTKKMLNETKKNETSTVNKLNLINRDISARKSLIGTINSEISALDGEINTLTCRKDSLQKVLEALKLDYAKLIRETHYADMQQSPLMFILSADNFNQMLRRIRYMQSFANYRKTQVAQIQSVQAEIDEQNAQLDADRSQKKVALSEQQRAKDQLQRDERKQQQMLQNLKKKEKDLLAKQKQQQKKADDFNKKIQKLIEEENRKASKTTLTKEQKLIAGGFEANKGKLPWPTEKGFISGKFGRQPHPTLAHVEVNNKGIYIQTVAGANARAVYEGEVTACFNDGTYYAVIVRHGNYRTIYANLEKVFVKMGDKVKGKDNVGVIATNPDNDNATELYFQVLKDKDFLDPSLWLAH